MEDNEYYYNYYREKYYNACAEINSCDQRIYSLQQQRKTISQSIISLNAKIRKLENTVEDLEDVLGCESKISSQMTTVNTKIQEAAVNYSGMVSSSDVANKDLTSVYSDDNATTKTTISNVFATVRTKKTNLSSDLSDLQAELQHKRNEQQSADKEIGIQQSNRSYWQQQKTNAYYNMEYYRRKMMAVS